MTPEELLSQLKDIHEPAAIGFWPPAPGWWALIITVVIAIVLVAYLIRRHIQNNAWKKEANKTITQVSAQVSTHSHQESLCLINKLIKRIAHHKLNDPTISALTGQQWKQFLESFLNGDETPNMFNDKQLALLSEGQYQPEGQYRPGAQYQQGFEKDKNSTAEIKKLIKTLRQWIKEA
ncbi:DUF4381 domain-containing protein [Alkalimarinus coralli]|uniref:DUF4381 domain-containing protein n=1 Tax=Alkalimarinus coralli TaxID=2935863 RepID=UPI00202ACF4A|nr:DUF4381 domain-containing protein [Alkalimarinus coralli]